MLTAMTEMETPHECAVVCVPKTIDNDVPIIDKSFGFDTACTEARKAIDAAYVEATCNANCIGFVKLMGKNSGFIAMNATLSSRVVDICLVPEMDICPDKLFARCEHLMKTNGYAVIVVSEGCGGALVSNVPDSREKEFDVGLWLKDAILAHFKKRGLQLTIKYIDPTYMIRTVPANAFDNVYCTSLAQHAVHVAMAGFTGCTVGRVYERFVYLPLHAVCLTATKRINVRGRWMARVLFSTQQPSFEPDGSTSRLLQLEHGEKLNLKEMSTSISISDIIRPGDELHRLECTHLSAKYPSKNVRNALTGFVEQSLFLNAGAWSTQTFQRQSSDDCAGRSYLQMLRSGPREFMHRDPQEADFAAAIVTCGGICPGLNSVIREVVLMLLAYGVRKIYGIIGGYKGVTMPETWIELTKDKVQDIHTQGGSILVSDRGNPPHIEIAKSLRAQGIRSYFVLGGDGTQKGASQTYDAMQTIDYECAVVGIPKTIDNDIPLLDTSFGFDTACTEAAKAIDSGFVESTTNANCIGLVKLMGRHCGFIALHATLAAGHVDVCLIPEMNISREKLLNYIAEVMKRKKHMVIVVAEGCGDTLLDSSSGATDGGGNKVLADVGPYLKDMIAADLKRRGQPVSIKYIDPTYMIRSVPANAFDSVYCSLLAQQAVHGAMSGYTGVTVGKVDERYVMLPVHAITGKGSRKVDVKGRMFERLLATTRQPSFAP